MSRFLSRPWARSAAIFALYVLIAIIVTYPLIARLGSVFAGFTYGDAYENAHHIWWITYALKTGQPLFYQTMLGYPNGIEGVTLHGNLLLTFPGWLLYFVLPLPVAYNLQVLLTLALNGWAMYLFARALTDNQPAAIVAGVVFMIYPTIQGNLGAGHVGMIAQWPLPLYAWALLRLAQPQAQRRDIAAAALFFILTTFAHTLQLIYTVLPVTAFYALVWLVRRQWAALGQLVMACSLGAVLLGVYLLPIFSAAFNTTYVDEGGTVRYSADLLAAVTPSFFHPIYGSFEYTHRVLGINLDEGAAYVGICAGILAIVGVWRRRTAHPWLALALVVYVLSLGPLLKIFDQPVSFGVDGYTSYIALPWALVQDLPGFNLARTPARFNFVLALAVAVMAAYGAAWWFERPRRPAIRWALAIGCAALIVFDYQTFFPLPTTTADIPDAITTLRERDDVRAIFDIPWQNRIAAKEALYLQTAHETPLIAGQVTRQTPVDPALLMLLETTLDPALLDAAGADVILVHKSQIDSAQVDRIRAALGDAVYEDDRFALFQTPPATNAPSFTVLPSEQTTITGRAESYLYAPEAGWVLLSAHLSANDVGQFTTITLDGKPLWQGTIAGAVDLHIPLPLSEAGYDTVSIAVDPPCPTHVPPGQVCRAVTISDLAIHDFTPAEFAPPVEFERGVTLAGRGIARRDPDERSVTVWLWWQFDAPIAEDDVRFVHILNDAGELVAQIDMPIGTQQTNSGWTEAVVLALPDDLTAGTYSIETGWYSYPDITLFRVLGGAAEENSVIVGEFSLSN